LISVALRRRQFSFIGQMICQDANLKLSVVLCTHNPRPEHFTPTLAGLRSQTLPLHDWELIVVDNGSKVPVAGDLPSNGRIIREDRLGLCYARPCGFRAAKADIVVMVDDDNVLEKHYLENAHRRMQEFPQVGMAGGRNLPVFEVPPPPWLEETGLVYLACRDYGDKVLFNRWEQIVQSGFFISHAPAGAGMVARKSVLDAYLQLNEDPARQYIDRRGNALSSGSDNDIILTGLEAGFQSAYFPDLSLQHLLPKRRLTLDYIMRFHRAAHRSIPVLMGLHGVYSREPIAKWTIPARAARAALRIKPWKGPVEKVRFQGALGVFEGRADLRDAFPDPSFPSRNLRRKK
jgi:glycosyltransferase involved in cell wall biosynthesis